MTKKELEEKVRRLEIEIELLKMKMSSLEKNPIPIIQPYPVYPYPLYPQLPLLPQGPTTPNSPWYEPVKIWCNTSGNSDSIN